MHPAGKWDVAALKRDHSPSSIAAKYVEKIEPNGSEYKACCPFHKERTASFTIVDEKGYYHCFGCGWHGDIIQFIQNKLGVGFNEACEIIAGERKAPVPIPAAGELRDSKSVYQSLRFVDASLSDIPKIFTPLRCWNPKRAVGGAGWTNYLPSAVHPYYDAAHNIIGIVLRIDLDGGRKLTPQMRLIATPDGEIVWSHCRFDRPQPLYGLELIASCSEVILWVEGEKCADAAREIGFTAISSAGGGKNIAHVDFSPLKGKALVVWGDADEEGEATMIDVCAQAQDAGAGPISYIPWDRAKAKGWDIADALQVDKWSPDDVGTFMQAREKPYLTAAEIAAAQAMSLQQETASPAHPFTVIDGGLSQQPPPDAQRDPLPTPFRILGHNHGKFYYMPTGTQQIVELSAAQHTISSMLNIAPLAYWEQIHPHKTRRFDLTDATDALMRRAETVGIFDIDRMRGRGAWIDAGEPVVHMGNKVLHGGRLYEPSAVPSHYLYEAGKPLKILHDVKPCNNAEANRFVEVCNAPEWENPLSADLLAGYCIVAPVCGALHWRSHVWITGPAQTWKTGIRNLIMAPMLGPGAIQRDGSTTEAHLRQTLYHDALPVIIDEAESEDKAAAVRMKAVLALARVASSGGSIGKGSADGHAIDYQVRTMLAFVSINPSVSEFADETRISKLITRRYTGADLDEHFATLERMVAETMTPEYCAAMYMRTVANLPTLLKNIEIFTRAARAVLRDGRAADQIGTLLGGRYLCNSSNLVDYGTAVEFIRSYDWGDHTAINATNDEFRLLRAIALNVRRITTLHGPVDRTIGELILGANQPEQLIDINHKVITAELGRIGIKVLDEASFVVANNCLPLTKILDGTPWASDWKRGLRALPGAEPHKNTYFSPGFNERATKLPLTLLTLGNGLKF